MKFFSPCTFKTSTIRSQYWLLVNCNNPSCLSDVFNLLIHLHDKSIFILSWRQYIHIQVHVSANSVLWQIGTETDKHFPGWNSKAFQNILKKKTCMIELPAICWCFFFLPTGPISSILVNKYGSRPVMIAGGILCSFGMIASSFCNSVLELYICIGVVGGKSAL